jgi:hypothetical protein
MRTTYNGAGKPEPQHPCSWHHLAPQDLIDTNIVSNVVAENARNGTEVGLTVQVEASAPEHPVRYSFGRDNSGVEILTQGAFGIDPVSGVVAVADATQLDYETSRSETLTVLATDGAGRSVSRNFWVYLFDTAEGELAVTGTQVILHTGLRNIDVPVLVPVLGGTPSEDYDPDTGVARFGGVILDVTSNPSLDTLGHLHDPYGYTPLPQEIPILDGRTGVGDVTAQTGAELVAGQTATAELVAVDKATGDRATATLSFRVLQEDAPSFGVVEGSDGNDIFYLPQGSGIFYGGEGRDVVLGSDYNTNTRSLSPVTLFLGNGDDETHDVSGTTDGGAGDDYLGAPDDVSSGPNFLLGGEGQDYLATGRLANDVLDGGPGQDFYEGDHGYEIIGTPYDDGPRADVFVLRRGEADGDRIASFDGNPDGTGDVLNLVGFGRGATLEVRETLRYSEVLPDRPWTEYDVTVRYEALEQPRSERFVLFSGGDFDARPVAQGGDVLWG